MTAMTEKKIKLNKIEKVKAAKHGLDVKKEIEHFAEIGWEALNDDDLIVRLKWLGIFFRPVTPGKFMLRLRMPNGILNSQQLTTLAQIIQRYGDDGSADITTRQNIQLRGVLLEDIPTIFGQLQEVGLTSIQSGMDNVRNLTGSPVAGIDPHELYDTREVNYKLQAMITNNGEGNYELSNLPRKFNIAVEGGKDNSIHAEINDVAFIPAYKNGELGFNVLIGGYLSAQRCAEAIPMDVWVKADDDEIVELCRAILTVYTTNGLEERLRENRGKARLMWLIDKWTMNRFRIEVEKELGKSLEFAAPEDEITMDKRDHLGVHPQKQEGYNYIGIHIPVGRLDAEGMFEIARLADVYGTGEIRATVEQNFIIPYVADDKVEAFLSEPILERYPLNPSTLVRSLVSCTGARYCNFALVETKARGLKLAQELDEELNIPERVRIHWTGCPNSCGQAQAGDIGLMGTKAKKDGSVVEGVNLFLGGKVGKDAKLGELSQKSIPCDDLKPVLKDILINQFGATVK
ncbi:assimilatory nitrite reductase (ferredoxin) precursor [Cyanobacterium stanieri PCC 7202]|uniref:Assimilatory nitrite reductase (Ferredoxin) n=1 Tax=Cyanobacterium stanieri (strain ATCC 29140 / PCC 7202) TaxID=292563 RepID=K9YKU1_CYASC|nr:assimilatory nitrite reductase (ferredoxin) precursor [Cyanobacterium stanieri PCC 7202]